MREDRRNHGRWQERDDLWGGLLPALLLQAVLGPLLCLGVGLLFPNLHAATFVFVAIPLSVAVGQLVWLGPLFGYLVSTKKRRCANGVASTALATTILAATWAALPFLL